MGPALLVCLMLTAAQAGTPSTAGERYLADLRARIAKGDVDAEVTLGNLYETGDTVPLDPAQAATWYLRAAGKGHIGAQTNLAAMYLEGHGVIRDVTQAVTWFEKAAIAGDAMAALSLGVLFDEGTDGLGRDPARASGWYRRAADLGLAAAQHRLGGMFRDGRGVSRDARQALEWLRKASELGHPDAQLDLGALLLTHAPADRIEAHMWLNLAASRWKHEESRVRAASLRDDLAGVMTSSELAEAYRRATEWQDRHAWGR